jgi:hypothetical protein
MDKWYYPALPKAPEDKRKEAEAVSPLQGKNECEEKHEMTLKK